MIHRRAILQGALATAALARPGAALAQARPADDLVARARALAARPHVPHDAPLPPPFDALTYDSYRAIRPRDGGAGGLDMGPGYSADLLPPGFYFTEPVTVEIVRDGAARPVPFAPDLFTFGSRYFGDDPPAAAEVAGGGFSGLRLRHPLNAADRMDEFLVMQGASYFRAIGRDMIYGLSARAVAIGTGGDGPEEFPRFSVLRLHPAPAPGAEITVEGLIESPSLTGVLRLHARPGAETVTRAHLTLFPRRNIDDIGIAPLTSMYFKGPLRSAVADDFRPRVHDSNALQIRNGAGEELWRPLSNPGGLQMSAFVDDGPQGYALVQTPREFADFQDAEAAYHRRPNALVRPAGDWGAGAVTLVEIPTADEFMDNIVAFWRPEYPLRAGVRADFDYDIVWTTSAPDTAGLARVAATRSGRRRDRPGRVQYVIDFDLPTGAESPLPDLSLAGTGAEPRAEGLVSYPLPIDGRLRVAFWMAPGDAASVEMRLVLRDAEGRARSVTWLHRWTPARDGRP